MKERAPASRSWLNFLIGVAVALGVAVAAYWTIAARQLIATDLRGARLALLPTEGLAQDSDAWLRWGLPTLVGETLALAPSSPDVISTDTLRQVLVVRGADGASDAQRAQTRRLAAAMGATHLLGSRLRRDGSELRLELALYDRQGALLEESSLEAPADQPLAAIQQLIDGLFVTMTEGIKPIELNAVFGRDPIAPRLYAEAMDLWLRPQSSAGEKRARLAQPYFEIVLRGEPKQLRAKWRLTQVRRELGDRQEADRMAGELVEESVMLGDPGVNLQALRMQGLLEAIAGNVAAADHSFQMAYRGALNRKKAAALIEPLGDRVRLALGDDRGVERVEELLVEMIDVQRRIGDKLGESDSLLILGNFYLRRGELDDAARILGDAAKLMQEIGDDWGLQRTAATLGEVSWRRGDVPRAVEFWTQALDFHRSQKDKPRILQTSRQLGEAQLAARSWREAEKIYKDLRELAAAEGDKRSEVEAAVAVAWLQLRLGYKLQAREPLNFALERSGDLQDRRRLLRVVAWYAYEEGHYDVAARSWGEIKRQAGTAWTDDDEAFLQAFRKAAAEGERQSLPGEPGSSGPNALVR